MVGTQIGSKRFVESQKREGRIKDDEGTSSPVDRTAGGGRCAGKRPSIKVLESVPSCVSDMSNMSYLSYVSYVFWISAAGRRHFNLH